MEPDPSWWSSSILKKVESLIPKIDCDFSSAEKDEFASLYELSLEDPEDLEEFSMPDVPFEDLLQGTSWPKELFTQSHDDVYPTNSSTKPSNAEFKKSETNMVLDDEAKLDASLQPHSKDTELHEGFPVLSFAKLDKFDLDAVLQTLKKDKNSLQQDAPAQPWKIQADGDRNRYGDDIMKKLAIFAKTPSDSGLESPSTQQETSSHKHNPKMPTGSQMHGREMTGKSMLLKRIREQNKNVKKYTDKSGNHQETKEMEDKPHQQVDSLSSSPKRPQIENPPAKTTKKPNEHQILKEKQAIQHEETLKQFIKHQPTKSVNLKQAAAEHTDVLYDPEVSHLEPIKPLPADTESKGRMLLTVKLSSPGVVEDRAHGKRKYICPAASKPHFYNTLVAWFLSLTGSNSEDGNKADPKVPFCVVGLQQMWTEDGLALHVLIVARHSYTSRKRGVDIHTPFYTHVSRFLSETPVTAISTWLPKLTNLLDPELFTPAFRLPSSCLSYFVSATSNKMVIDKTFGANPGFYWQTVEAHGHSFMGRETTQELHTEVSVVLGNAGVFKDPLFTHVFLHLVFDAGLDVCGLRLLYPKQESESDGNDIQAADESPVVLLAVRGPHALSSMKDLTSLLDPVLSKTAEKTSINPLNHFLHKLPPLYSSQLASQAHRDLCRWFSGRITGEIAQNINQDVNRILSPSDTVEGSFNRSPSFLCAATKADVLLVVSPLVPPCFYARVLSVCEERGFILRGIQRLQLNTRIASALGLNNHQAASVYLHSPTDNNVNEELPSHSLILLLKKENVLHHCHALPSALMKEFKTQNVRSAVHIKNVETVDVSMCFQTVHYRHHFYCDTVRCMWTVPDPSGVILSHRKHPLISDIVVLTLRWKNLSQGLELLHKVLKNDEQGGEEHNKLTLLGIKWLPALTKFQAQELSPYAVGEKLFFSSVDTLVSSPALVCVLRGTDAIASLRKLMPQNHPHNLNVLMSPTPEVALRQSLLFFSQHEMIPDQQVLFSVCLIEPKVWNHTMTGIYSVLQQSELTLVGLRVVNQPHSDIPTLQSAENVPNFGSGSFVALCLQGGNAVRRLLDVLSQDDATQWKTIYGSGSYQEAIRDVKRFFPEGLCCSETSTMRQEEIHSLYSDHLDCAEHGLFTQESLSVSTISNEGNPEDQTSWQTTCLLLSWNDPTLSRVQLLEELLMSGCHLVGGRMSVLGRGQWTRVAETLRGSPRGADRTPRLIMILAGEKIVTDFDLLLQSIFKKRPDLKKVGRTILYPGSEEEAKRLMSYLFGC